MPATRHDLAREGVVTSFASQLVDIPVLVSVPIEHDHPVRRWYLGIAVGLAVTGVGILTAVIATRPTPDSSSMSRHLSGLLTTLPLPGLFTRLCFVQLASPHAAIEP